MNPTLVLLPGLHGTDKLFAPFLAELSDRPCLPISLPAVPLTYPQLATHVSSQCASLPSFVIIAESFSGPIAASAQPLNPAAPASLSARHSSTARWDQSPHSRLRYLSADF